jgi:hypothetical protein
MNIKGIYMNKVDVNEGRDEVKVFHNLSDIDGVYTFYYDETNNIRKFYLKNDGFNASEDANFVLGGVMHEGLNSSVDFNFLLNELKLQKNTKEIKLKHIATGDFVKCLKSNKLHSFLNWLRKSDLHVHFVSVNILYFSIVDIVDSLMISGKYPLDPGYIRDLKDSLYQLVIIEKEKFLDILYKFEYPNIKKESLHDFIDCLTDIINMHDSVPHLHVGLTSIKQMLKQSKELTFIMNETDHQLIDKFFHFYLQPVCLFKNSRHIFDMEEVVHNEFKQISLVDNGKEIVPYKFENSKENMFIQISDVIVGLMGKLSIFINHYTPNDIFKIKGSLDALQSENLKLFIEIIEKSLSKNAALINNIASNYELRKSNQLLNK